MTEIIEFEEVQTTEKKWEFRELKAADLFPVASLISKLGVEKFAEMFVNMNADAADDKKAAGLYFVVNCAQIVLEHLDDCEKDIYKLLASTSNLGVPEIKELGLAEFIEMIIDFFKNKGFADFFKQVSLLLK